LSNLGKRSKKCSHLNCREVDETKYFVWLPKLLWVQCSDWV